MRPVTLLCCTVACLALAFLSVLTASAGEWYPGLVHVHSTFSDGRDNVPRCVEKAKETGYKFMIITDHYELIAATDKGNAKTYQSPLNHGGVDYGFADYVRNCKEQTKDGEFVTIPGAEVSASWHSGSDTWDSSHTLALGPLGSSSAEDPYSLLLKQTGPMPTPADVISGDPNKLLPKASALTQAEAIACVNEKMHMLPVAAHPTLVSDVSFTDRPWEPLRCRYDLSSPDKYAGIKGVEFFNVCKVQQNHDVLAWYLSLVKQRQPVFVTSGCDSHTAGVTDSWQRVTWVFADSLNSKGILKALGDGQSYAAANGACIKEINYRPGKSVQTVDRPEFRFTIWFLGKAVSSPKTIVMYRDGAEVADSRRTFKKGLTDLKYEWNDTTASAGEHWYVLWIDGCLVTSPIRVNRTAVRSDAERIVDNAVKLFGRWGKQLIVGDCIANLKKDGYRIESIDYGPEFAQLLSCELVGELRVFVACYVRNDYGDVNLAIVRRLGVKCDPDPRDDFTWTPGTGFTGFTYYGHQPKKKKPEASKVLDKLLPSLRVTTLIVRLPEPPSERPASHAAYRSQGLPFVKALENQYGAPSEKYFDDTIDGWVVTWSNRRVQMFYGGGVAGCNLRLEFVQAL